MQMQFLLSILLIEYSAEKRLTKAVSEMQTRATKLTINHHNKNKNKDINTDDKKQDNHHNKSNQNNNVDNNDYKS